MEVSSLIASNNKKHYLVVFIGLVLILKIALISAANEESQIYTVHLGARQHDDPNLVTESHHDILGPLLGSKEASRESMIYSYRHGFSGFAAKLTSSQARKLSEHPDVVHVSRSKNMKLKTTRVSDYLGLTPTAPVGLLHDTDMGSEAIVGVLDSGIWPVSESLNDKGLGPIPARWKGQCVSGEEFNASSCNRKLIGATYYAETLLSKYNGKYNSAEKGDVMSPLDKVGHGTHCATTAAGSFVQDANFLGLGQGLARGSAPKARIASYKVCWNDEDCYTPDIVMAMDHAIRDGVDVISMSLGSDIPLDFEVDKSDYAIAAFHAVMKGIPVVCAGGNDGPKTQTISNVAPWMITVAATTMDREFFTPITLGNNITLLGQEAIYSGKEVGFTDLLYYGDLKEKDFQAGIANGKILFLFLKDGVPDNFAYFAKSKGASGFIIARHPKDNPEQCNQYLDIACAYVDYELGMDILLYIQTTGAPVAKISPTKTFVGRPSATKVAKFSSRGPNSISPAILKPDIAAPGSGILAAISGEGYEFFSGTSMATPVISGIVALLRQKHPNWSPAAIRSALVTTALQTDPSGEPITAEGNPRKLADPFDYGGGLVNPVKVADPGLVYDMGYDEYVHYMCSAGYDDTSISKLLGQTYTCPSPIPSMIDVNLPSITIPYLSEEITVTRTVTNVGPVGSVYRAVIQPPQGINVQVNPQTLEFGSNTNKITFTVKVSTTHRVNTDYLFGSLTWTDNGAHNVRIPLSVRTRILNFKI